MRCRSLAARTLLAGAALLGTGSSSPTTDVRAAPTTPKVAWSPCYREQRPGLFECGAVQVPLDDAAGRAAPRSRSRWFGSPPRGRARESGRSSSIRADRAARVSTSWSGIAPLIPPAAAGTASISSASDLARHRAQHGGAVLRGTPRQWAGLFHPVRVPRHPRRGGDRGQSADQDPASARATNARPRIIDHMATADVARDLELLRGGGGRRAAHVRGRPGQRARTLGVTYANLFPGRFRALVVDGVLDPVAWSTGAPGTGIDHSRSRPGCGATPEPAATLDEFFPPS